MYYTAAKYRVARSPCRNLSGFVGVLSGLLLTERLVSRPLCLLLRYLASPHHARVSKTLDYVRRSVCISSRTGPEAHSHNSTRTRMPHKLPIELHDQIIACLVWYQPKYRMTLEAEPTLECASSGKTLAACALVCKTWLHLCRKQLYRLIHIRDPHRFEALARTLPSVSDWLSLLTEVVHVVDEPDTAPFSHLAPYYLATRVSRLRELLLTTERFDTPHLQFHSSLLMQLAHLGSVSSLRLSGYYFVC